MKFLKKLVAALTVPAERGEEQAPAPATPMAPAGSRWQGWQGWRAWPPGRWCSGSLAEQVFLFDTGRKGFSSQRSGLAGGPLGKTNSEKHNQNKTQKLELRVQKQRGGKEEALISLSSCSQTILLISPLSVLCDCGRCMSERGGKQGLPASSSQSTNALLK